MTFVGSNIQCLAVISGLAFVVGARFKLVGPFELGAPVALLHRRIALVWCIAAWAFHVGVALLMSITFLYPLSTVAYLPLFRVERALAKLSPRGRLAHGAP